MNRLQALKRDGQSIWLDFIDRKLMSSGKLAKMIEEDGICGLTSNPAIFQKSIGDSDEYDASIAEILRREDAEPSVLFEAIAIDDIRNAADVMRSVYQQSEGIDGYISLEVSPHVAHSTEETLQAARRLWKAVDRPNLMVKVPGTPEGIDAMRQLTAEGINVNVTLLFSRDAYRAVANAYIDGLEKFAQAGGKIDRVASVASFFVSRIDVAIDALLEKRIAQSSSAQEREALQALLGKVAIANAKLAYQDYLEIFDNSQRWQKLARAGAHPQRLLWASTGTKNPKYRDVVYMEALVGANTVNTVPPATLDAFRDHGESHPALLRDLDAARNTIAALEKTDISLKSITDQLIVEGLVLFADADDKLMSAIAGKRQQLLKTRSAGAAYSLGTELKAAVDAALEAWRKSGGVRRLWARDATLWTGADEARWLDWLDEIDKIRRDAGAMNAFAADLGKQGFTTAILIGMGGSSLGPEVLSLVFGGKSDHKGLKLLTLDSMDPAQIAALEATLDFRKTLFVVASKSGSTLEPDLLCRYFHAAASKQLDNDAGAHFIAITDPGSKLREYATGHRFRKIFDGEPGIGGRYSIYSNFGMVPAALLGIDLDAALDNARLMVNSCRPSNPPQQNPGAMLGLVMAEAAKAGHDKLTLIASPSLAPFGAWVEQLVAESTGKHGHGVVPIDAEPIGAIGAAASYGNDRLFVYLRLESNIDTAQEALTQALAKAGHPVVTITLAKLDELLQEFFRWEIATAVVGAALGINPFDQPDVEAAKVQARGLLTAYERNRRLPQQKPLLEEAALKFYASEAAALISAHDAQNLLRAFLSQLTATDYFAILAYLPMFEQHQSALQTLRQKVRDKTRVATTLGFGPRYLHSTGQLHKGGPNNGVFLVLTCDAANDIAVPDSVASFGVVKSAQAQGDVAVLTERGRRVLQINLGSDVTRGLATLAKWIDAALI